MKKHRGFTIVELLIVVVVIAILAAITIVAYNGISSQAKESALKSELASAAKQLQAVKASTGSLPADTSMLKKSDKITLTYSRDGDSFCLSAISADLPDKSFRISDGNTIEEGDCGGGPGGEVSDGAYLQTITSENCPTAMTRAVDARDNHTYWVKRLADGKCWMLTNLAYGGGGANAYGDVMEVGDGTPGTPRGTLSDGTADTATTSALAKYYVVPGTVNYTVEPQNPSTLANGTGQYGYLYNFCSANGGQSPGTTGISACSSGGSRAVNTDISVCPAGWRLPTGLASGDIGVLNTAVNGGLLSTSVGLRDEWLVQFGGMWGGSFSSQNSYGYYWTSLHSASTGAYYLATSNTSVAPAHSSTVKRNGMAIRCLAV